MKNTKTEAMLISEYNSIAHRILATAIALFFSTAYALAQQVFVSSRNSHEVKLYDLATGNFIKNFVPAGSGGLSFPQEVLWHPDGFLLVTGRGNNAIKKYDGTTGAYLGNFTSGYSLDNPTKTTFWQDSLIYVSQWGTVQNKVVRFDLKTGAFVDEFTSIGVPTGDSHAWDAAGNLFVPQWGDGLSGRVLKFDTAGVFTGTFIPTTLLDGPVNLWFDDAGNLFVVDWTRGDVLKFNGTTGALISPVINTASQLEGFAFDSQGRLYLGDWSDNKVYRYDFASNLLAPFIETGGLIAPNSILIREVVSPAAEADFEKFKLSLSPNPAGEVVKLSYFLEKTAPVQVGVLNVMGQNVATLFSGSQTSGEHQISWNGLTANGLQAQAGVYFLQLAVEGKVLTRKLVWQ